MLIIINYLSKGFSGVRPIVINTLLEMINKNVIPFVPEKGSVGSSGDLAPSAHIILVLIGRGQAYFQGKLIPGKIALQKANIKPLVLEAKEGLALINNSPSWNRAWYHSKSIGSHTREIPCPKRNSMLLAVRVQCRKIWDPPMAPFSDQTLGIFRQSRILQTPKPPIIDLQSPCLYQMLRRRYESSPSAAWTLRRSERYFQTSWKQITPG